MDYTEVRFYNDASLNEAIIAWLGENDYDMFEERADGLNAYIESGIFSEQVLKDALSKIPGALENIRYETQFIKDQNWNTKWESNFEPVRIANRVYVRAPFHEPVKNVEFEIVIEPKMSFGTGHHSTTSLMIQMMLEIDLKKKKVLDIGCGTGILSILAERLGAETITAVDIEEWAFLNCLENCDRNDCRRIKVIRGDLGSVTAKEYDFILANINRNILLSDIPGYSALLKTSGELLMSGILGSDKETIDRCSRENGFEFIGEAGQENWLALRYKKV